MNEPAPLPVTVIGGYLGAGKTTLVNTLLANPEGRRFAVLVNDFGAVNVDAALIAEHSGDTMALTNGCICCSIVDGFTETLGMLRERRTDFDHVLIEVSGVGDPWKVAQWGRTPGFTLDAVVVLAAADTIEDQADDPYIGDTIRAQLRRADVVVSTKLDLVSAQSADQMRRWMATATEARIVDGPAPLALLVGSGAGPPADAITHPEHATAIITPPADLSRAQLDDWLHHRPETVLRVKGVVEADGEAMLVQAVGARCEVTAAITPPTGLVAIAAPHTDIATLDSWTARLG